MRRRSRSVRLTAFLIALPLGAVPVIERGGVRNAASLLPQGMPGGGLAPGMRVAIRGLDLAGTTRVVVAAAGGAWYAPVLESSPVRAVAVIPAGVPPGTARLSIERGDERSAPAAVRVGTNSPGLFSLDGSGRGAASTRRFARGSHVVLPATGMGGRGARVLVWIGGVLAQVAAAVSEPGREPGVDALAFVIPHNAPAGCAVPVQARIGTGPVSNAVTVEIEGAGECLTAARFDEWIPRGGRSAMLLAFTLAARVAVDRQLAVSRGEGFAAAFLEGSHQAGIAIPAEGTCMVYASSNPVAGLRDRLRELLAGEGRVLDAGRVWAESGGRREDLSARSSGVLYRHAGGAMPAAHEIVRPAFFAGNSVTVKGSGGKDAGPFEKRVALPEPLTWPVRDAPEEVDRTRPLRLAWKASNRGQPVFAGGLVLERTARAAAGFVCRGRSGSETIEAPSHVLEFLPQARGEVERSLGFLFLATVPESAPAMHLDIEGLNGMLAVGAYIEVRSARFR
ncbi:MAG TPA: hypothetical protein DEH78_08795 [Solibacterales bacterium]|nr:hypothetical protein [Bryobacterales bacterium]